MKREIKRLKVTQAKDRLMVLAGIFTGLRLGGILNLCWQDIDFNKRLITFSHKTGKLVSIPLSDYLSEELLRYKESNQGSRVFEAKEITRDVVNRYSEYFSKLFKSYI